MSFQTKAYLFIIICTGFASLAAYLPAIGTADPFRFAAYLVLAMLASCMKVSLPGITGTVSVLFVFLLIGITDLSLPETLIMGAVAACVQSFWHAKKPRKLVHFSFNVASIAIAIQAAYLAYTAPVFLRISVPAPLPLLAAALVFFAANTLTVAVVIALTEGKPVLRTWTSNYFWSFPYYIIGACVAGLFSYFTRLVGWQTSILALPVVYLIYRSYRLYLDRLDESRSHGEQLRIAANRLNAVLESTSDCVFAVSDEGRITYTNKRARSRLFGDSDVVGTILWEKFPKLESSGFRDQFKRTLADKIPLDDEVFFPELNAWFEVRAYPSTEGIALYLKEVTEQRELSEQLRQAQRMEVVGRLAGGVRTTSITFLQSSSDMVRLSSAGLGTIILPVAE